MKKLYRTLSIDEFLARSEAELKPLNPFTSTLRFTKSSSSKSLSILFKLKNENHLKALKIKELQDQIERFSLTTKTQEPELETDKKNLKNSMKESIKDCEEKTQVENSYSGQLKKMIVSNQETINELKAKNVHIQDSLKKLKAEHEKLLTFTSNANSLKVTAQNTLQVFTRSSNKINSDLKKSLIKKKNEIIGLENLVRSKAEDLNKREIEDERMLSRKHALINHLHLHLKESEKIQQKSSEITSKLNTFQSSFEFVFKKIGYQGSVNHSAIELIIQKINQNLFNDGSVSERYVHLSQLHHLKVEELDFSLKELKTLMSNLKFSNFDVPANQTFNNHRFNLENVSIKIDNQVEMSLLNVYGKSLTLFHRFLQQLKKIEENSSLSVRSMVLYKDLEVALTAIKREGRKTLFKAVSHQSISDDMKTFLLPSAYQSIEQEVLKYYPGDYERSSFIYSLIKQVRNKQSPITKFMLTFDLFEDFLVNGEISENFPELLSNCFKKLESQYKNILKVFYELLESLKNPSETDSAFKHQFSITDIRRNCLHVKTSLTVIPKTSAVKSQKIRKKSGIINSDQATIESIQDKIENLKRQHMRATRSSENLKNHLPEVRVSKIMMK